MLKEKFKGFAFGVIVMVLCLGAVVYAQGNWRSIDVLENGIELFVDGSKVVQSNFLYENITYVPLRVISESLGFDVQYDNKTDSVYVGPKTSDFQWYPDVRWLPDFEYYTKRTLTDKQDVKNEVSSGYIYTYKMSSDAMQNIHAEQGVQDYFNLIISLGFQCSAATVKPVSDTTGSILFSKDNHVVAIYFDYTRYQVVIAALSGY